MSDGAGYGVPYQTIDSQGDVITTYPDGVGPYIYEQDVQYAHPVNGINQTSATESDIGSTFTASLNGVTKFTVSHGPDGSTDTTYFVTGRTYATQTLIMDYSVTKVELDRYYATNKPQMIAIYNSDGSLHQITDYDTHGRVIESDIYAIDGSRTVALDTYGSPSATVPSQVTSYDYDSSNHLVSVSHDYHMI